jgi:hypothetical protein
LSDLARTRLHLRYHVPADAATLTAAYGTSGTDEAARLDVYEVLHAVEERAWIATDRPAGWYQSVTRLDEFITFLTSAERGVPSELLVRTRDTIESPSPNAPTRMSLR